MKRGDYEIILGRDRATLQQGHDTRDIPLESVDAFIQDVEQDYSSMPLSGDPDVDSVIRGKATYLGKGMDGIAFRTPGKMVVKISTTIPFHPMHQAHRTPEQALLHTRQEAHLMQKLRKLVSCIPKVRFLEWAGRGWLIKPYLRLVEDEDLTDKELEDLENCIHALHEAGWALGDTLQYGIGPDGKVYLLDLGQARQDKQSRDEDIQNLRYAAKKGGRSLSTDKSRVLETDRLYPVLRNQAKISFRYGTPAFDPVKASAHPFFPNRAQTLYNTYYSLPAGEQRVRQEIEDFLFDLVLEGIVTA